MSKDHPPRCQWGVTRKGPERCPLRATHRCRWADETVRVYCRHHASMVDMLQRVTAAGEVLSLSPLHVNEERGFQSITAHDAVTA